MTFLKKYTWELKLQFTWEFYSFADLQKPQVELDGKACAAVGQSSLMATYDDLFSQVNVVNLIN
jgi:ribosomal protein S27AE